MYEAHFQLKERPFALTPDVDYFFNSHHHQNALNVLQVALDTGEGFVKVTGEIGTGKTLLCRTLLKSLADPFYSIYIPNPYLSPRELKQAIASELGITGRSMDQLRQINENLIQRRKQGQQCVLIIDEAQSLPANTLESLRLLTNLETEKNKLLQVVLFGQPELDQQLSHAQHRQLLQRITFSYQLKAFSADTTKHYVQHRLQVAGRQGVEVLTAAAYRYLHLRTEGIPRVVNIVCHKAMMLAYGQGQTVVDIRHIKAAVNDTQYLGQQRWHHRWLRPLITIRAKIFQPGLSSKPHSDRMNNQTQERPNLHQPVVAQLLSRSPSPNVPDSGRMISLQHSETLKGNELTPLWSVNMTTRNPVLY